MIVAIEVLPLLEAEAKERQRTSEPGVYGGKPLTEIIPEAVGGESREKAAELVGFNPRYISDGKRMKDQAPDVFEAMRAGHVTIPQARVLADLPDDKRAAFLATG